MTAYSIAYQILFGDRDDLASKTYTAKQLRRINKHMRRMVTVSI